MGDRWKRLSEWPFEHKYIAALTGLGYGPAIELAINAYCSMTGEDWHTTARLRAFTYAEVGAFGVICNLYWLHHLGKLQPPRMRNFFNALQTSGKVLYADVRRRHEDTRNANIELMEHLTLGAREIIAVQATYHLRNNEFGPAMDLYAEYLDAYQIQRKTFDEYIVHPLTKLALRARAKLRGETADWLQQAFAELRDGDKSLFTQTWPRILETHPDHLELKIMHAAFHSAAKSPDAQRYWESIVTETTADQSPVGHSRNQVLEISTDEYLKGVIIIKKGPELEKEYKVLEQAHKCVRYNERITVAPLAFWRSADGDTLITKRKKVPNLETMLTNGTPQTEMQEEAKKAMSALASFHRLPVPMLRMPDYDPVAEVQRRFIARLGNDPHAQRFLRTYRELRERAAGNECMLIHGDFYPTNVLQGGIIVDLEKASFGNLWFDIETFISAPGMDKIDREALVEVYRERFRRVNIILSPEGREFWAIHAAICQMGSNVARSDLERTAYYQIRAVNILTAIGEHKLREQFEAYTDQKN